MFYDLYLDLCKQKNISPTRAALEIGISKATPTTWKKRGLTPQGETLNKIAGYFNVSVDYLLGAGSKAPAGEEGRREVQKEDLMAAFWGGDKDLSPEELDAMWQDVERFAAFVAEKKRQEKRDRP